MLSLLRLSSTLAQESVLDETIAIHIEQGTLESGLQQISQKTGWRFAYRQQILEQKFLSKTDFTGTLAELLDYILQPHQLCYTPRQAQIIIHKACVPKYYTVSGYVVESGTQAPVPYVSLSLPNGKLGILADHEGYFELKLDYTLSFDSLIVSCMGYYRDTLIVAPSKSKGLFVDLRTRTYTLPEAVVRPEKYEAVSLGNKKGTATGSIYLDTHGQQSALFVQNKKNIEGRLSSIAYFLSKKGNTKAPFRVRVYNVDSAGKPGVDLIKDVIIVKPEESKGWYKVDVSHEEIDFPAEGLFIAIEGVFPDDYDYYMGDAGFVDLKQVGKSKENLLAYGQRLGYNKREGKNTWHYSMSKVWFQLEKKAFGVMMSATIEQKINTDNYDQEKNTK